MLNFVKFYIEHEKAFQSNVQNALNDKALALQMLCMLKGFQWRNNDFHMQTSVKKILYNSAFHLV